MILNPLYSLRKVPIFRLYIFFIVGILITNFVSYKSLPIIGISIVLVIPSFFLIRTRYLIYQNSLKGFGYCLLIMLLGGGLLILAKSKNDVIPDADEYKCIVLSDAKKKKSTKTFFASLHNDTVNGNKTKIKVVLKDTVQAIYPGDIISFNKKPTGISNYRNPNEFNYALYLKRKCIQFQVFLNANDYQLQEGSSVLNPKLLALKLRSNIIEKLNTTKLSHDSKSILYALTLGYKDIISSELVDSYSRSGAMHILAVSGLHVGIIYMILNVLFGFLKTRRFILYQLLIILLIWQFAFLTGLTTSVLRASLMFTLFSISKMIRRDVSLYNVLATSAFLLTAYNPNIIFDVGFQLSYSAVAGIVFLQPYLYGFFKIKNKILDYIVQLLTVSVAAQISTLPLTLYYFNQFPVFSWLISLLIIPLVFVIIIFFVALNITFPIIPVQNFIADILNGLLWFMNGTVRFVDNLTFSTISEVQFSILQCILIFLIIIFFAYWLMSKNFQTLFVSLLLIVSFIAVDIYYSVVNQNTNRITVFNVPNHTSIFIKDGVNSTIIGDQKFVSDSARFNFFMQRFLINANYKNSRDITKIEDVGIDNNLIISNSVQNILLLNNNGKPKQKHFEPVLLLPHRNCYPTISLNEYYNIRQIILDGSMNKYVRKLWVLYANTFDIPYFDISENGAFDVIQTI